VWKGQTIWEQEKFIAKLYGLASGKLNFALNCLSQKKIQIKKELRRGIFLIPLDFS